MGCMARRIETEEQPAQPSTTIGENLRRLRQARGFTQEQLAATSGVSRPTITNIEVGKSAASSKTLAILAKALGVDPSELSRLTAPPEVPGANDGRIPLTAFLSLARGLLDVDDVRLLERLRTRLRPEGFTRREWMRIVMDLRNDTEDEGTKLE